MKVMASSLAGFRIAILGHSTSQLRRIVTHKIRVLRLPLGRNPRTPGRSEERGRKPRTKVARNVSTRARSGVRARPYRVKRESLGDVTDHRPPRNGAPILPTQERPARTVTTDGHQRNDDRRREIAAQPSPRRPRRRRRGHERRLATALRIGEGQASSSVAVDRVIRPWWCPAPWPAAGPN